MSEVEKLKQQRKAERLTDPHSWAYEMERRIDNRSLVGITALLISLFLGANVWLLWQQRDDMLDRVDQLERASRAEVSLPPEGYELVE
jgi:uncharacterized protein HemX